MKRKTNIIYKTKTKKNVIMKNKKNTKLERLKIYLNYSEKRYLNKFNFYNFYL